jgi:hypothetical protein
MCWRVELGCTFSVISSSTTDVIIGESMEWVRYNDLERGRSKLGIKLHNVLVLGVISVEANVAQ